MEHEDGSNNKRKWGQRGSNKMLSSVVYVTKLDSNGLPSKPAEARKAFKHASKFQVRDNVLITITDWQQVPATIKEKIWSNMKEKIKFPTGTEDVVKSAMLTNMGRLFRKWKSEMNSIYVKKGLVPKHMGKIIEAQWKEFVQQKIDHKALAISNEFAEMMKSNIYPHRMGSSGYVHKIPEWKKKIEEDVYASNPNLVDDIEERTVNWLLARSELTQDSKLVHKKKGVAAFQEKVVELTAKKRLCLFKFHRENDILSGALGNAEHNGHIRGIASQMPLKIGFPNDAWSCKKCDRYKRNLEYAIEEKMNTIFVTKFRSYMQNLSQERQLELQQVTHNLSPSPLLSIIASIAALCTWYPIDDITGGIPCRLHIPLGRVGNKIKEDAIGVAMPRRVFHNNPTPTDYAKMLVHEIIDMSYIDYSLDHVTPEGVKELGEAINQFILWHRCEIVLDGTTSPQNQLMSPLSQMAMPKDKEAPPPTSPPPVPRFKEASLLSSPKEKEASLLPMSPVKVMSHKELGHQEQDLPPSSPYNTIHQDLGLYKENTHSNPMNKFFEVMKKQNMSAMSALTQQAKSYPVASKIDSYEEDGEVYDREKLGLGPNDPIFMRHEVPKNFEFGKPFLTSAELSK
jgi:hypothetical protein